MGRSLLSFAVGLGGLDLSVGIGNTPGILSSILLCLAACQASMLLDSVFHRWPSRHGVLRMMHRVRVSASPPPLTLRYYELWCSEWLRDICENTSS